MREGFLIGWVKLNKRRQGGSRSAETVFNFNWSGKRMRSAPAKLTYPPLRPCYYQQKINNLRQRNFLMKITLGQILRFHHRHSYNSQGPMLQNFFVRNI